MSLRSILMWYTVQSEPGLVKSLITPNPGDPMQPIENMLDFSTATVASFTQDASISFDLEINRIVSLNSIGFAGHNMPDGTVVEFRQLDDTVLETNVTSGRGPQMFYFEDPYDLDQLRIVIFAPGTPINIGSFYVGAAFVLPSGLRAPMTPPPVARQSVQYPSTTAKGSSFLGSTVQRIDWAFDITQDHVEPLWVRLFWRFIAKQIESRPFFYSWNYDSNPFDVMYAWTEKIIPPKYTSPVHMSWSLKCRGLGEP